jgi:hypothetical protein
MSDGVNYSWQQYVVDAFIALPESLPAKISIAERAISARFRDPVPPDLEESLALQDALRALGVLIEETGKPGRREEPEQDIA